MITSETITVPSCDSSNPSSLFLGTIYGTFLQVIDIEEEFRLLKLQAIGEAVLSLGPEECDRVRSSMQHATWDRMRTWLRQMCDGMLHATACNACRHRVCFLGHKGSVQLHAWAQPAINSMHGEAKHSDHGHTLLCQGWGQWRRSTTLNIPIDIICTSGTLERWTRAPPAL